MKIKAEKDFIEIKSEEMFVWMVAVVAIMFCFGIKQICELLPLGKGYEASDLFGVIFMCVWTALVGTIGIIALVTNIKKVDISETGVLSKTLLSKKTLEWSEIKDYGLSYCGKSRSGWGFENTYYLYFSKDEQQVKNNCKKKLKGKMIKVAVMGESYGEVINEVLPFCKERTGIEPFIGEDKYHLL